MPDWIARWGVTEPMNSPGFDRAYLDAALRVGTAGTGMFGMRLMRNGVVDLCTRLDGLFPNLESDVARFDAAFNNPVYLHLTRRNRIAQAVSRYRAERGGLWHLNADGSERERTGAAPVGYDRDAIARFVAEAEGDDEAWDAWFERNRITPLRLTYEALADQPAVVLSVILATIGCDPAVANRVVPRTKKLADETSAAWVARFKSEMS